MKALVLVVVLVLSGCCGSGTIKVDAVEGTLTRVVLRHQSYVEADTNLTPLEKRVAARDGTLLLKLLSEAKTPTTD
jgi:hypothetical protein